MSLKRYLILVLIIALQLGNIIFNFAVKKDGLHSDESWSFGLANSHEKPNFFYYDGTAEDEYKNEWITGETFKDYITVNPGQEFDYGNVIYNLKQDIHPPLYFLILHTICSFFPGQFSKWYSFPINIVAFVILQFFLFALVRKLTKSDLAGYVVVAFYGFSGAGLNTFVFARQYALLAMFGVMLMYFHLSFLTADAKKQKIRATIALFITTALGSLTHYFFLPFAFMMAVLFCFGYLIKKNWAKLVSYALAMLSGVGVSMLFSAAGNRAQTMSTMASGAASSEVTTHMPAFLQTVINSVSSMFNIIFYTDFEYRASMVINAFIQDFTGVKLKVQYPYIPMMLLFYALLGMVIVLVLSLLINLSSGSEKLSKNESTPIPKIAAKVAGFVKGMSRTKFFVITIVAATLLEWYFTIGYAELDLKLFHADRYISITYPALVLLVFLGIRKLAEKNRKLRLNAEIITAVILAVICLIYNIIADSIYLYPRPDYTPKFEETAAETGDDVILLLSAHWVSTCYTTLLYDAKDVFLTNSEDVKKYPVKMKNGVDTDEVLLVVDEYDYELRLNSGEGIDSLMMERNEVRGDHTREQMEKYYIDFFKETFPEYEINFEYEDSIMQRDVFVYRMVKK
ncbi:MAG: glycosyltransferase family 39 protein [Lachnospiraceae bacterium]|nr:glycosyltransferase family 39 protein [Lachnospiraceae bacterium]